jgi:transposase
MRWLKGFRRGGVDRLAGTPPTWSTQRLPRVDRAGWHTAVQLPQWPNLSLLPLPAGSPELTPPEQVWQQLRDRSLANRCYDSYEQIVDACCDAWNAFTRIPAAIRSLCARSWASLSQSPVMF